MGMYVYVAQGARVLPLGAVILNLKISPKFSNLECSHFV